MAVIEYSNGGLEFFLAKFKKSCLIFWFVGKGCDWAHRCIYLLLFFI